MNLYNPSIYASIKDCVFDCIDLLDSIAWGSFSMLDLALAFLMIGAFLPVVLNLRNVDNAVMSGYSTYAFGNMYKQYRAGLVRNGHYRGESGFLRWKNSKG